jgi:hypothetical protein
MSLFLKMPKFEEGVLKLSKERKEKVFPLSDPTAIIFLIFEEE